MRSAAEPPLNLRRRTRVSQITPVSHRHLPRGRVSLLARATRPMKVQIRVEMLFVKPFERFGVRHRDMTVAHVLADHRAIL